MHSIDMSGKLPMRRRTENAQVRHGCIPHGRGAYRESDSFAMWAVNHGVAVSMTTVSISSDPFTMDPFTMGS